MLNTFIITPVEMGRVEDYKHNLRRIGWHPDNVVAVVTNPNPIELEQFEGLVGHRVHFDSDELNISKWYRAGMDYLEDNVITSKDNEYQALCLETDAYISYDHVVRLSEVMVKYNLTAVGADWKNKLHPNAVLIKDSTMVEDMEFRLPGIGLMINGRHKTRHNPAIRWWLADDWIEFAARRDHGTGLVGGTTLEHGPGAPLSPEKAVWYENDMLKFIHDFGTRPY